jgi:hypothetical protein
LIPSPALAAAECLQSTFSLRYSLHHFYSLIQRKGDGTLVLGVSRTNPTLSEETVASRFSTDDSRYNEEIAEDSLRSFEKIFPQYASESLVRGEGLDHAWTGVIAMTTDSVPFVGAIDSLPGQYICAGFNGHGRWNDESHIPLDFSLLTNLPIGMARIFTCAPGVAKLVSSPQGDWKDTGLPECFQFSPERLARLSAGNMPSIW